MGNYKNFNLAVYFVAEGTNSATEESLQKNIDFFNKYMRLDKVYLEPFRSGIFASEEKVNMCKRIFEQNGIKVEGGITTNMPDVPGEPKKQRLFDNFCYNDNTMMAKLSEVSEFLGKHFDAFIIDDFYFTNCTCDACRKGKEAFNKDNGITDGSWQAYRTHLMYETGQKYMIAPAKKVNPNCKITIKYPNWMESYQETGYDPERQKNIFDFIYTGTETRDPLHTDQHLPRYLSFSLMRYMEKMAPGRNGGGWFDPFDCQILDYYLEQAYLTAFAKAKELMMFCFQALCNTVNVPALGFMLDKLDNLLDKLGEPIGISAYIPNASQGEDNLQDFLGMQGFPIIPSPEFDDDAPAIFLTASSAYDLDILDKLENYLVKGGKAIVSNGFVNALLTKGLEKITSIRFRNRYATFNEYIIESDISYGYISAYGKQPVTVPVMEFRNNATWGGICKGRNAEESYTLLARDTYSNGEMDTIVLPDSMSDIKNLPDEVLTRMRKEFSVNGIYLENCHNTGLFIYDNDTFVIYPFVSTDASSEKIRIHTHKCKSISSLEYSHEIKPLYESEKECVFVIKSFIGKAMSFKINM